MVVRKMSDRNENVRERVHRESRGSTVELIRIDFPTQQTL